jgi:hypothetical protein
MAKIDRLGWAGGIAFSSYGLSIGVRVNDPAIMERIRTILPPGWKAARSPIVDWMYSLRVAGVSSASNVRRFHLLYENAGRLGRTMDLEDLLERLESSIQMYVAEAAQRRVFVHAGVVSWRGRAIVLPGPSHAGKTSLVAALVRAGATYYSDEYAVFDSSGRVHPYPRLMSIRGQEGERPRRCPPEALGGRAGVMPLPVGLVIITSYQPGARWRPEPLSPGRAALALLSNTVPARARPAAALATLQQVVARSAAQKGRRGEAEQTATAILAQLES